MKKSYPKILLAIISVMMLASCGSLDKSGAYKGDKTLYLADKTIVGSYSTMHSFVQWEFNNREALQDHPEIKQAADNVRLNAHRWVESAIALREAYAANPTAEGKSRLNQAIAFLQAALLESTKYLNTP